MLKNIYRVGVLLHYFYLQYFLQYDKLYIIILAYMYVEERHILGMF